MQSLFIYDNNGTVVAVNYGVTTIPSGVQSVVADMPDRMKSAWVNPTTKEVTFEIGPDTESEVSNLQDAIIELEARVSALEG